MFLCHVCGSNEAAVARVSEVFEIDGKHALVEGIPATVCTRCGEAVFSRETTERIRRMVRLHPTARRSWMCSRMVERDETLRKDDGRHD